MKIAANKIVIFSYFYQSKSGMVNFNSFMQKMLPMICLWRNIVLFQSAYNNCVLTAQDIMFFRAQ